MTEAQETGSYAASAADIADRLTPPPAPAGREAVTALVLAGTHEGIIRECLQSLAWCDELLVVIDTRSNDATRSIVEQFTDRIFDHEYASAGGQRNFGIPKASCQWVLAVDADEAVTPELRDAILKTLAEPRHDAYYVMRAVTWQGRRFKYLGWGNEKQLRLFRRDRARYDERRVHAKAQIRGTIGLIPHYMTHRTVLSLKSHIDRANDFTSRMARDLHDKGRRTSALDIIFRPPIRFIKMYFLKLGFLEGMRGLIFSAFACFYVFQKYAKLWEMQQTSADAEPTGTSTSHGTPPAGTDPAQEPHTPE